jgi:hypothetical protein
VDIVKWPLDLSCTFGALVLFCFWVDVVGVSVT